MNWQSWLIAALITVVFLAIVIRHVRRRKNGCACGCDGCPHAGCCLAKHKLHK